MKLSSKIAAWLLVGAFALSMTANAALVHIDYEGVISSTWGNGMGYTTGETINGWFEFDTDDLIDTYGDSSYLYSNGPVASSEPVDNHAIENDYDYIIDNSYYGYDQLLLQDGSYETCYNCASGNYYEYAYAYHYFNMYEYSEWLDTNDIIGGGESWIDVTSYYNYGNIYETSYDYATYYDAQYGNYTNYNNNGASFTISSLHVNAIPEPGMIGLMGLGLLGLVVARRRKQFSA
ncbi:MAG: PEP-CTERM sorting domain-containing protein [Gammaproteobacteria bacterium]|nr:PEP-CTERM sorting domain-containing protein [Gammaproteobacteria bacterium]